MYCEYWNLSKPPFDNVPDPSMYVDCHVTMENVIAETIFAIKEANESFAVIIGDVGLGKTLSLRIIIDSLEQEKYKVALITNPNISFGQLLREIIGQITGKQCEDKKKSDLLEIFNHLIFETTDQGKKIVIFIDEANALSPANLENLRLLTNMQDDHRNLFTLVLVGQLELGRRLEHPKRINLFQRVGTYGRIDKLPSEESVKTYINTRLKLAGSKSKIFSNETIGVIWEYSDNGVPRLINKICKLCLKAGETNKFKIISAESCTLIAERFQKLSKTAIQKRKPRSRHASQPSEEDIFSLDVVVEEAFHDIPVSLEPEKVISPAHLSSVEITSPPEITPIEIQTKEPLTIDKKQDDDPEIFKKEHFEELVIGKHKFKIAIPDYFWDQTKSSEIEIKNKLAGYLAAQIIKDNQQLTHSANFDPVSVWNDIKDAIMKKLDHSSN